MIMAMSRALRTLTRSYRFFSESQRARPAEEAPKAAAQSPAEEASQPAPRRSIPNVASPLEAVLRQRFTADQYRDSLKVASQSVQWTYTELNRYSTAFALGLVELGLQAGDRVAFWTCKCDSAETVTLQLACARTGLTVLPVPANDKLADTLKQAKVLVLSPWIPVKDTEGKRIDEVLRLIPEMRTTHWGTPLKSAAFPNLRYVIQLGHSTIRGAVKAKNVAVYTKEGSTNLRLASSAESVLLDYSGQTFTQGALVDLSSSLASDLQLTKGQTLLNFVNPKNPASLLGTLATFAVGARTVLPGTEKKLAALAASQHPQVVLVDSAVDLAGSGEVDALVVAGTSGDAVAAVSSKLRDVSGLKAKKVVGVHSQTLKRL